MSLMIGYGPHGTEPAGSFNFDRPRSTGALYFEDSPRRIRAHLGGETVVDSRHAKLLHEHGHVPVYYFPEADVRMDLLEATDHSTRCPWKGEASHWSVRAGDRVAENAVWSYPDPLDDAPPLAGHLAFHWRAMDEWLEVDEPDVVHARDPYTRIDVLETSRHVEVSLGGEVLADTRRARVLFESGLPPRWYIPREDVRMELLAETGDQTACAYKGFANALSIRVGDSEQDGLAWTYPEPRRDAEQVRDYVAFLNEGVDLRLDGEDQERPVTKFSPDRASPHG